MKNNLKFVDYEDFASFDSVKFIVTDFPQLSISTVSTLEHTKLLIYLCVSILLATQLLLKIQTITHHSEKYKDCILIFEKAKVEFDKCNERIITTP